MMAGGTVFAPLFFKGHRPKYQHLLLHDMIERVNCPAPIKKYMIMTEFHTASGNRNVGQGGDFIQEELIGLSSHIYRVAEYQPKTIGLKLFVKQKNSAY